MFWGGGGGGGGGGQAHVHVMYGRSSFSANASSLLTSRLAVWRYVHIATYRDVDIFFGLFNHYYVFLWDLLGLIFYSCYVLCNFS